MLAAGVMVFNQHGNQSQGLMASHKQSAVSPCPKARALLGLHRGSSSENTLCGATLPPPNRNPRRAKS